MNDNESYLFSLENYIDPGRIDHDLSILTVVEEMLIARIHIYMEVRKIRGVQYKYSPHVCSFLRDTNKIYNTLLLISKELDLILLRSRNISFDLRLARQFVADIRIRRSTIEAWLRFL